MDDLGDILSLMSRMRLFPENNNRLHKKFVIEDKVDDLLNEGIYQSYDANDIYRILLKHYNIGNEENFIENGNEIGICFDGCYNFEGNLISSEIVIIDLVIPKNFSDTEKIKKFLFTCGWTLAQEKEYYVNNNYIVYVFHKNRQVTEVELPDILYHLTPITKLDKILTNGLTPRTSNILSNRNERIYLLKYKRNLIFYHSFASALWKGNLEKNLNLSGLSKQEISDKINIPRDIKYCLLEIDTTKCNNLRVFADPDMDGAVWTFDNIPPQAIKVLNKNI